MANGEHLDGRQTALVVDDSLVGRRQILESLRPLELRGLQATDVFDALVRFVEVGSDIVVAASDLPRPGALEFIRRLREFSDVPVVALASRPTIRDCESAMRAGASRFLERVQGLAELAGAIRDLLHGRERERFAPGSRGQTGLGRIRERRREELRVHLGSLLLECQGNVTRMAERLQKDRATVIYHLKRFDLFEPARRRGGRDSLRR